MAAEGEREEEVSELCVYVRWHVDGSCAWECNFKSAPRGTCTLALDKQGWVDSHGHDVFVPGPGCPGVGSYALVKRGGE